MNRKYVVFLLVVVLLCSYPLFALAAEPVDEVICTTTRGGDYKQLEETVLQGKSRSGNVVWTYSTGMKECGNDSNIYWYGQSGNLFFLNYKGSLHAFDVDTGTILWNTPEGSYSFCQGIFDDKTGNLCMVNTRGPITLLDRNGVVLARYNTDGMFRSLVTKSMYISNINRLEIKYAETGTGANKVVYQDYNKMPSFYIDLSPYQNKIKVTVDNNPISFDVSPFVQQDRTYVPVRAIFEALGAQVNWNGETKTVTAQKDGTTITLEIGTKQMTVNGVVKELDVSPQIVHNRTMVPARAVSEGFGYTVGWDASSKTVTIVTTPVNPPEPPPTVQLTLNTNLFSYIGQTYGALSASLGAATHAGWWSGPYCKLPQSDVWFGFDKGDWYQSNEQFQLTNDLICTHLFLTAGTLFSDISTNASLASIAQAFGVSATTPQRDMNNNLVSYLNYNNFKITLFLSDDNTVSANNSIVIER